MNVQGAGIVRAEGDESEEESEEEDKNVSLHSILL
jgi:hypothetical protein